MSWDNRLREASYTSPSGVKIVFNYEDVSKTRSKNTAEYIFPDARGSLILDLGSKGRQFPMRIIFWGDNCDLEADQFEAALFETGRGKLSHPIYGLFDVVPFGSITRRDDLKTKANQVVIDCSFFETLLEVYPTNEADPYNDLTEATAALNAALAEDFANNMDLSNEGLIQNFKDRYDETLDQVEENLRTVADAQASVQKQFDEIEKSINRGIDVLIRDPLNLAYQNSLLIQSPARAASDINARMEAYANLTEQIFTNQGSAPYQPGYTEDPVNYFYNDDLSATAAVSGSVISAQNNEFETRTEAMDAVNDIAVQFDNYVEWKDANIASLELIDTGASYQALQKLVSISLGFLIEVSFTLKNEKILVLPGPRNMIELCSELYGSVDENLDYFIQTNNFTGSQMIELKKGERVVYYS